MLVRESDEKELRVRFAGSVPVPEVVLKLVSKSASRVSHVLPGGTVVSTQMLSKSLLTFVNFGALFFARATDTQLSVEQTMRPVVDPWRRS